MNRIAAAERELTRTKGTPLERAFDVLWVQNQLGVPSPQPQYVFARPRRYTFDRAWPAVKVAVELEGGIWLAMSGGKSRHTFPPGFMEDCRKYNLAACRGWLVFRLTRGMLDETDQLQLIATAVKTRLAEAGLALTDITVEQQHGF